MSAAEKIDDSEFDIEGALTEAVENSGETGVKLHVVNMDLEPIKEMAQQMMAEALEVEQADNALRNVNEESAMMPLIGLNDQIIRPENDDTEISPEKGAPIDELAAKRAQKQGANPVEHAQQTLENFGETDQQQNEDRANRADRAIQNGNNQPEQDMSQNDLDDAQKRSADDIEQKQNEDRANRADQALAQGNDQPHDDITQNDIDNAQKKALDDIEQKQNEDRANRADQALAQGNDRPHDDITQNDIDDAKKRNLDALDQSNAQAQNPDGPSGVDPQNGAETGQQENQPAGDTHPPKEPENAKTPQNTQDEEPTTEPQDGNKQRSPGENPDEAEQNNGQPGGNQQEGQGEPNDEPYGPEEKNPKEQSRAVQMMNQIRFAADIKKLEQQMDAIKEDIKKNYEPKVREVDKELGKMDREITKLDTIIFSKVVYALAATLLGLVLLVVGVGMIILAHMVQIVISIGKNIAERKKIKMDMKPLRKKRSDLTLPIQKKWKEIGELGKKRHKLINRGVFQGNQQNQ